MSTRSLALLPSLALLLLSGLLWTSTAQPARAQQDNELADTPGYVDFDEVSQWFDAPANIEVNLRGALLDMIASSSREAEPEFAGLVGNLEAIQVRGFPMTAANQDEVLRRFEDLSSRLETDGWERVVYLREDDENVNIYMKPEGENIAGLTVMVTDASDQKTIFVNIVGSISPEEVGKIGRGLDIDPLKDMDADDQTNE